MDENAKEKLRAAVEALHGCSAAFRGTEEVVETFQGQEAWRRVVAQYDLTGHPAATVAYAWVEPATAVAKARTYAVLALGPVKDARDAVRATIAAEIHDRADPR